MEDEVMALHKNDTWQLVLKSSEQNVLSNKWVYRLKLDEEGNIDCHKARL